jgi:hypothetical protein
MNNLSNLNLDITKYSNIELKEILGLNNVMDTDTISDHISKISSTVSDDSKLPFNTRNKIVFFLSDAKNKLLNNKINMMTDSNIDLTYGSQKNYMINNTPISNPIIHTPTTLGSSKAVINEGRGEYYPAGYINPINIRTIKKIVNIDTRFRNPYYNSKSSDFHFDLPEPFKKVVNMKFIAFEIPISIHAINKCNSCFIIKKNSHYPENNPYIIDISSGNYHTMFTSRLFKDPSANIETVINKELETLDLHHDLSYNIDPLTGFSQFELKCNDHSDNTTYDILFNTDCYGNHDLETPLPLKLGWLLGFRAGAYKIDDKNKKVISEGIVNLDVPKYLYISINDFTNASNNNFVATFSDSTLSEHILGRIEYRNQVQTEGLYNGGCDTDISNYARSYYGPVDIKKLHIKVFDEYGRIVDFNNMDWSFTLEFDILYD